MRKILLASAATFGALLATAGGALAQPLPNKIPAPGTIVVHVNGYLQFELADYGSTFNSYLGYKLNPISTDGDVRIYPGFDAQTVNGVDYGVQVETRVTTSNAGKAVGGNSTSASGTSSVYIRRAYGYIGSPYTGFVRFGQTDSVFGLMQTGNVQAFGDGGQWNDDGGPQQILPTAAAPGQFVYADQGALYATDKVLYLTPAYVEPWLGGSLSGGAGFEPNSNALREGYATNATASSTSAAEYASPTAGDIGSRRRNTVDVAAMYALKMNGFASKFSVGYLYGAPIAYDGTPTAVGTATHFGYNNLSVYEIGAQTTYMGITLGANLKGGQVEDGYTFKPKGARSALTYIIDGNYVLGPYVVGASFFDGQTSGSYIPGNTTHTARTLSEYGVAVGGNYVVGKDLSLFMQYLYGHRHQPGNSSLLGHKNTQVDLIAVGATFKW